MDANNRFETRTTFLIGRAENFVLLIISITLLVLNWEDVRWLPFIILFAYIDLIGYIPGAIAFRLKKGKVPKLYYFLYNFTHNYIVASLVAGLWCLIFGLEWALLALPIHLLGDRAIFGNSLKTTLVSFEGEKNSKFSDFESTILEKEAR